MSGNMFKTEWVLIAALACLGPATNALAGDAASGEALAADWCTTCHATGMAANGSDVGPTWTAIAQDAEKTDDYLTAFLTAPHWPMENIELTRRQIDDLIAYIRTLEGS